MSTAREQLAQLEAMYARVPPRQRLAMGVELLEWTVANFSTPIADDTVRDLVARAEAAVSAAVRAGRSIAPNDATLLEAMDEAIQNSSESGSSDLLMSYYLCFEETGPELTPQRLVVIFDHCYQADYTRYSEPGLMVDKPTETTARERAILEYQRDLLQRYSE